MIAYFQHNELTFLHNECLFPVTSVKKIICNFISFTIFHLSEEANGGVLLGKEFLEISLNSQENTCGKVYFFNKVAG